MDYNKQTAPQLKAILKQNSIAFPASAKKADLVNLLKEQDATKLNLVVAEVAKKPPKAKPSKLDKTDADFVAKLTDDAVAAKVAALPAQDEKSILGEILPDIAAYVAALDVEIMTEYINKYGFIKAILEFNAACVKKADAIFQTKLTYTPEVEKEIATTLMMRLLIESHLGTICEKLSQTKGKRKPKAKKTVEVVEENVLNYDETSDIGE